jgi:RimJ/RimL family protein N-acetyltransferase
VGLLMHYVLNLPSDPSFPGLGLRRLVWFCNTENAPSITTARRLGFELEVIKRWYAVVPEGGVGGEPTRAGDPVPGHGRHYAFLSVCWDRWEREARAIVERQMARRT